MSQKAPLVLLILDGWGYSENKAHNAIAKAKTPQWNEWWASCPHILLEASGNPVGLPKGQMGNSEVGHMHIGAGRIIPQDFTRINEAIEDGSFARNEALNHAIDQLKTTHNTLHLMGLFSPGGVHSHEEHLFNILKLCHKKHFDQVCLHLFLDGRDTPPQSALPSFKRLNDFLRQYPVAQISSISGRYYAMDRDNRWDRIEPVYNLITKGQCTHHALTAQSAIEAYYQQTISDEFIPPTLIGQYKGMAAQDAAVFFNFRADRARQLTSAFIAPNFQGFNRHSKLDISSFISMTQYDKRLPTISAFPPMILTNTFGEIVAAKGLNQLRIAETEKYAHVTFFFNGGSENIYPNEQRIMIPSPKVATYDLQPQMSAPQLTEALIEAIESQTYDVIICNYANADMVGHSGNFKATIEAIECLDQCMAKLWKALGPLGGQLVITADHGNAEVMYDPSTQQAHTAHTHEPVPLLYVGHGWNFNQTTGSLIDIAPTLLTLLGITPPPEMTGRILMEKTNARTH